MHDLLKQQLVVSGGTESAAPADWPAFVDAVSRTYEQSDWERTRLDQAMGQMSKELNHRNLQLHADIEERMKVEQALRESEAHLRQEIEDRQRMEVELRLKQKLESVGQLAAGIAHEINTPVQYVSDSMHFLREAIEEYRRLLQCYRTRIQRLEDRENLDSVKQELMAAEEAADLAYLDDQVPKAVERIIEGTGRVASIVRAVKDFAHPDQREKAPADINKALQSTLLVARTEYKYLADIQTDWGELPMVPCHIGDLNQVFLNLLVNAAQSILDARRPKHEGLISVRTAVRGPDVVVSISDTGSGIPDEIQERIFDPFFTTKEVGRGSGQGLSIARAIVVEKHGGSLTFDTEVGKGTTFHVRIPIDPILVAERAA